MKDLIEVFKHIIKPFKHFIVGIIFINIITFIVRMLFRIILN